VALAGEVLEGAVRDHVHALAPAEQVGAVTGVHDHGVHLARDALVHRLAADHVVHGQDTRPGRREQVRVDALEREPLEVADVGRGRAAAVTQHVGHVLGELHGPPAPRRAVAEPCGQPVERLAHAVAHRRRRRAVHEARGDQLHADAAASQRRRERVVVWEHVPGWIDQVHQHAGIL
jgi:hypothetical protein